MFEQYQAPVIENGFFSGMRTFFSVLSNPSILWQWIVGISYWVTVILSVSCLLYYTVSQDPKGLQKMWLVIVVFLLIKAVDISI